MADYPPELSLRDALGRYFADNGFPEDGGYGASWVTGRFGPIPFAFPNIEARRRAVRFHDLHHLVTGYGTDGPGEAEISAWEIATGCRSYWAAWLLNLTGLAVGFLLVPRRAFEAFVRGRHSANLYAQGYDGPLLDRPVGEVRAELVGRADAVAATTSDHLAFAFWWTVGAASTLAQLAVLVAPFVLAWLWLR